MSNNIFEDAQAALQLANIKYAEAKVWMAEIEAERRKFLGTTNISKGEIVSMIRKLLPMAAKYAGMAVGGGGLAALIADKGAFKGIIEGITGIFGG